MRAMNTRNRLSLAGIAVVTAALAASTLTFAAAQQRSGSTSARAVSAQPDLAAVRDRVESWLSTQGFAGFKVSEVMAFSNNDYVAVNDKSGKPAFELLYYPRTKWLLEEHVSMMWNTRYGMMRGYPGGGSRSPWGMMGGGVMGGGGMMGGWSGWYGNGSGKVTSISQAVRVANAWLASTRPGESAEDHGVAYPGYYTIDTIANGKTAGMLSVNARTGAVWYHGWHGKFLSEQEF
jgi:hypothetical protein